MAWAILQIVVFLVLLGLIAKPLGTYMAHVYRGERTFLHPVLRPVERLVYRLCGIDETREMGATGYAISMIVFNFVVLLFIYVVLRLQGHLPLNPAHVPGHESMGRLQHRCQLRDQHQLAGVRAGDLRELPLSDARAGA